MRRTCARFSCTESVERSVYVRNKKKLALRAGAVTAANWPDLKDYFVLAGADRYRLEFAVFDGRQLFSWPGARTFEHAWPSELIGSNDASSAGEFGPFAISVFLSDADPASIAFQGLRELSNVQAADFRYSVARDRSHFLMRVGESQRSVTAFEGDFLVDPSTGELKRLVVDLVNPPVGSGLLSGRIMTDYATVELGGSTTLMPTSSTTILGSKQGDIRINRTDFSECREFKGTSVLSFADHPAPANVPSEAAAKVEPPPLPPGLMLSTLLLTPIDSRTTFAGDRVEAGVEKPVSDGRRVVVPKGAKLTGRVVGLRRQMQPAKLVVVAIVFDHISMDGSEVPVAVASAGLSGRQATLREARRENMPKTGKGEDPSEKLARDDYDLWN